MKRVYHTWEKWECYRAGFYESKPPNGWTALEATRQYAEFLKDTLKFEAALKRVISEWSKSCEHYLSNVNMNRIAWLGQASACLALGLPASFRGGYHLLSETEQQTADGAALEALNAWLEIQGEPRLTIEDARCKTEMELY